MRHFSLFPFVLLFSSSVVLSQTGQPFTPDSLTRALWHFDELTGSIVNDAAGGNNGLAYGTSIVPGRFGNARSFNGAAGDYVHIPSDSSLDFGNASFTIDVWFKTTTDYGMLIRRGMAPLPGYNLSIYQGRIGCQIGNRTDSSWPDTVLTIITPAKFNDGAWHLATMVRDRVNKKLSLYADGVLAAPPIDDNITFPITCNRPLTIGRWESDAVPDFYTGSIDEVRLTSTGLLHPPVAIAVSPAALDFGWNRVQSTDSLMVEIRNTGNKDTLRVASISSTSARFTFSKGAFSIPAGGSSTLGAYYTPTAAQSDTGTLLITCNDPAAPLVSIPVTGHGYTLGTNPVIQGISFLPNNNSQARIIWFRSVSDSAGAADPVTQYSIWRLVPASGTAGGATHPTIAHPSRPASANAAWDFIQTVPAIGLDEYAAIVLVPYTYSSVLHWYLFIVVAQTKGMQVYTSQPDSILDPPPLTGIDRTTTGETPTELILKQNYPNPFNPSTTIQYGLPSRAYVSLIVYNTLGQAVATLVNQEEEAGYHEARFNGSNLASGVYFCRLNAGESVRTGRILLIR